MRGKEQRGLRHACKQPAYGVVHHIRTALGTVVEDIVARCVIEAEMHVKAIARAGAIGLGHEGGDEVVLSRHALDDALEQHGIVGGGRGAGTGAAIGAGVGVVAGAAERDANARAAYESQYYAPPAGPGGLVANIQMSLTRLGYNPGPVDGVYGRQTADAISQFQHANRLPVTGQPSPQLLNYMISQGG